MCFKKKIMLLFMRYFIEELSREATNILKKQRFGNF